ncbi:acetate--CoA ligase [Ciceribacter thiooxidans]|uniref:acetate--CoA ligase n=1 Tax=Ciceribacter thiooxidans TaxID=1969821 RepID=A0ABV7IAN9_9HYPH|nr:acetate--CoA ligase [Ciceribacter thiooxidans]
MEVIAKDRSTVEGANFSSYEALLEDFAWDKARSLLDGLPGGGLNIAHEAVDRHVAGGLADKVAIRWIAKDESRHDFTYADLKDRTNRFANVLSSLGIGRGERVYALLGRVPELHIAALGTLKAGAVFCPMFSQFGPEPVRARMEIGDARVLVTSAALFKRKVAGWWRELPGLAHVLIIDGDGEAPQGMSDLRKLMAEASPHFEVARTMPEDMALLHFTSGTTGRPKGAVHVHEAVVAHHVTGRIALDLHPDDVFWCTADPGWVTGTSYGIISPLTNGVTMIVDEAEFDADRWYGILEAERVNVWYTAPTAIRMLMKVGAGPAKRRDLSRLRFMASVGEPLNPEAVVWGNETFGKPFHDNWWQTETGGIMIANYAAMDVKPGSMGKPLPGVTAGILEKTATGVREVTTPMTIGHLALRPGWPSMMRAYLHEEERYRKCFLDGWYLSGDLAMRDSDGYYWFVGRDDDVIKSSGHLIGPFEVESALMEHPAVAEAAVIGIPDETAGEVVKAFVALKHGYAPGEELELDLLGHARRRLGPAVAPKQIAFRTNLPKTRSGKIMRRLLKARELGLPEGDISTLESDER